MERVAFLIEQTGERISCLLNPESVLRRRLAGLRPRRSLGGLLRGNDLSDDRLLYTGGGITELQLDLLFDVSIEVSAMTTEDVRDLTYPLWSMAENARDDDGIGRPPLARFIWGKNWNIPGVITAVSERLEYFTPAGVPRRSWLRLRMQRVAESPTQSLTTPARASLQRLRIAATSSVGTAPEEVRVHRVVGGGEATASTVSERLDEIAYRYYLDPSAWRELAKLNGIDDPLHLQPGASLQVPFAGGSR